MESLLLTLVKDGGPAALCLALVLVFLGYLRKRDEQHAETIKAIVSDVKTSTQMMVDTVRQCTANQLRHQ